MKLRLLIFTALLSGALAASAQDPIDVTALVASPKNYIFSDQKSTVKAYIYQELKAKTTCCGTDRIYLEVKIEPSGYVVSAKTLTGKNECFKQSAVDIVKNIKWDAADFRGAKSIYFEITPEIDCENRGNSYTVVEVFNNPLLDKQGNRVYDAQQPATPPVAVNPTPAPTTPAAQPTPAQPAVTQPATQPAPTQPVVSTPAPTPAQPAAQPVQPTPQPTQPVAVQPAPVTTQPAQPVPAQPALSQPALQPVPPSQVVPEGGTGVASTGDPARDEELRKLKEQMEQFRKQEAARIEKEKAQALAAENRRKEAEARQNGQPAVADRTNGRNAPKNNTGDDAWAPAKSLDSDYDDAPAPNGKNANTPAPGQQEPSTGDPLRDEIARLEQQRRELEQNRQRKLDEQRQAEMATEQLNQNLLRVEEELLRKQEQAEQMREQRELDQIEQDRIKAEEQRIREQEEYQRMMDEIARLQREAEDKIRQLEDQKAELERIAELKQKREQEIVLERTIREKEQDARLEQMRLELAGAGVASTSQGLNNLVLTAQDSDKFVILINELNQLRGELSILREQIGALEGQTPGTKPATVNPRGVATPGRPAAGTPSGNNAGVKNAATNKEWQNTDNGVSTGQYVPPAPVKPVTPAPSTPAASASGKPATPVVDHSDTHANIVVPKPSTPAYMGGSEALKAYLSEELHKVGVCGLAQVAFSVTVLPNGTVSTGNVIKANTPLVAAQMTNIIRTLKFTPFESRIPQNLVLEFKGDIKCGTGENVDMNAVDPMIKP